MEYVCILPNKSFRLPNYEHESSFITISAKGKRPPVRSSQRFTVGKDILNKKTRERGKKKKKENKNDEKSEYCCLTAEWVGV